jgi:hypothetical protein
MMVPWSSCKPFSWPDEGQQKHKQDWLQMMLEGWYSQTSLADRFSSILRSDPPSYSTVEGSQMEMEVVKVVTFSIVFNKNTIEAPQN